MYGKVFDWVKGGFVKAISYVSLAVTVVSVTAVDLLAQEPATVTVVPPNIDWGSTAADLIGSLTGVVVVGIGIGLSLWALMIVNLFRRTSSGH